MGRIFGGSSVTRCYKYRCCLQTIHTNLAGGTSKIYEKFAPKIWGGGFNLTKRIFFRWVGEKPPTGEVL